MFALRRPRPLIWIALLAWLGQLCMPVAHASVMARHDAGIRGWCGNFSPAMAAKVAALPDEIRDIVAPGAGELTAMQAQCLLFCAGASGVALPAGAAPATSIAALGIESPAAIAQTRPHARPAPRPPARGPPRPGR